MAKHPHSVRDARKPGWFYIDGALITHYGPAIGAYGLAIYAVLAHKAAESKSEQAIIGYDAIAALLKIGRNTVIRTLRSLADVGVIMIDPQTDDFGNPIGANIYTLCAITEQDHRSKHGGVPTAGTPVPTQGTPMPQRVPGYPERDGGVPTQVYDHDSLYMNHESPTPTAHESRNGGGDDFFRELRRRGIGKRKAEEIAAKRNDHERVLHLIDSRPGACAPSSPEFGRLINDILDDVAGDYVAPARAVAAPAAPPAPRAGLSADELRALKDKHNPFERNV